VLPAEAGKSDPDEFAREKGKAGVDALLAAAVPLSEFLVDREIERSCGGRARDASLEAKLAAVRELAPLVRLAPEGLARTVFEDAVARRLDLDAAALRAELSGERRAPRPAPARPAAEARTAQAPAARPARGGPSARVRLALPGPAVDALALLLAFPDVAPVAEEENLAGLLPEGPLADLARALLREPVALEEALARLAPAADAAAIRRIREICGAARPRREDAERELRKSALKATIEAVRAEQDRLLAAVAKQGAPVPEDLAIAAQVAARRRTDLERRLRSLERPG
jgi:DNA primase